MFAPSDCSVLKYFVRKPVHKNRSKFFPWFKITSNQLNVNDVVCGVVFLNPPVSNQNNSLGERQESWRWSWLAFFDGKGRLHFVDESTKVDSAYYILCLVDDCTRLLSSGYIFQHTQLVPRRTGSEPTAQISLPKTSGLQIHLIWTPRIAMSGTLLEAYRKCHPKPNSSKKIVELKEVLCMMGDLGQPTSGTNRQSCQGVLKATEGVCSSWGGHFEHSQ